MSSLDLNQLKKYSLNTGIGTFTSGRKLQGSSIKGVGDSFNNSLPPLLTRNGNTHPCIPISVDEIVSPEIINSFPHVHKHHQNSVLIDRSASVTILIGHDGGALMKAGVVVIKQHSFTRLFLDGQLYTVIRQVSPLSDIDNE